MKRRISHYHASMFCAVQKGFTLIELLVVLAVLALLLAAVPPLLPEAIDSVRLRNAQRDLITGLRYARNRAASSQQAMTLDLNVRDGTMTVAGRRHDLSLPDDVELTLVTARREQLSAHEGTIRFYPDGSSIGGQVHMRRGEQVFVIDVNWLTGRVTGAEQ